MAPNDKLPAWASDYVGLPFKDVGRTFEDGVDCWGLVRVVYRDRLGVFLPSYAENYKTSGDSRTIDVLIRSHMCNWDEIKAPDAHTLDLIVFRIKLAAWHVGVYLGHGWFLHVHKGINTTVERVNDKIWSNRVIGYYRYAE